MKLAMIALAVVTVCGCRTIVITEAGRYGENGFSGLRNTVNTSLADVRNTESMVTIDDTGDDQGMQLVLNKTPASPQFMGMIEATLPEVVDVFSKALLAKGAGSVFDALTGLIDEDEVLDEIEDEAVESLIEKERTRRTPDEKAAARAARGARNVFERIIREP
jgi:hypothetical protein